MKTPLIAAMLLLAACNKTPEPTPSPAASVLEPQSATGAAPSNTSQVTAGLGAKQASVVWDDPKRWRKQMSSSPLRVATYTVPRAANDPEDAEVAVFYFGRNAGGDVESNINRWTSQFADVPKEKVRREERKINGLTQYIVEIDEGTYSSGMPGGPKTPKEGYGLIAAVVESPSGRYFFKMTGPHDTVNKARSEMQTLLGTLRSTSQ